MNERERAHVDGRGLRPPPAYAIRALPSPVEGAICVRLEGELDLAAAPELGAIVDRAVATRASALVLDLSELRFMDSSILKELLRGRAELGSAPVILAGAPPSVRRLLEVTATDWLFTLVDDVDAFPAVNG